MNNKPTVSCTDCGAIVAGASSNDDPSNRVPCPACGSQKRSFYVRVQDSVVAREMLGLKQKRPGISRPIREVKIGDSLYRKTNEWHKQTRIIDRLNARYFERFTSPVTGEIIHQRDEPLPHHVGRGSQKNQPHFFREEHVAIAAYFIWEREGRPVGRHEIHWTMAIEQLRRIDAGAPLL